MRKMFRFKIGTGEDLSSFMRRTNREISAAMRRYELECWASVFFRRVYAWAGHIARFSAWAPGRLAWRSLKFRGAEYLEHVKRETGGQQHGRKFKVWRWEQQFAKVFGPGWVELARDSEKWADSRRYWLSRRANDLKQ